MIERIHGLHAERANSDERVRESRIAPSDRHHDASALEHRDGRPSAIVGGLGKDNSAHAGGRARLHIRQERHFAAVLARIASATTGCTSVVTSPPNRATSRTRLALI